MTAERNKQIIRQLYEEVFCGHKLAAVDRLIHDDYIQHNPFIPSKRAGLRGYVEKLPKGRVYEPGMIVAEGDLVMVHGRYSGGGEKALVAADIFRFEGDQVVEHWDVLQEEVPADETIAGNAMFIPAARA